MSEIYYRFGVEIKSSKGGYEYDAAGDYDSAVYLSRITKRATGRLAMVRASGGRWLALTRPTTARPDPLEAKAIIEAAGFTAHGPVGYGKEGGNA